VLNIELQFEDSSIEVNSEAIPMLDSLATMLIQRRDLALEILNEGGKQANSQDAARLLQLRTQAIRDLLIRRGVPPSRIQSYAGKAATANPSFQFSDPGKTTFVFTKL
jgi:outer membrane protein OmpA-like peptidoglycan-associated protein